MFARRGQSIIEYTMIVGILTMVLYYMGTSIKRGVQSLVKVAADQVGNQQNSDQDFNSSLQGYMVNSADSGQAATNKQITEAGWRIPVSGIPAYITNINENEATDTMTNSYTNGGFTQTNPGQ